MIGGILFFLFLVFLFTHEDILENWKARSKRKDQLEAAQSAGFIEAQKRQDDIEKLKLEIQLEEAKNKKKTTVKD